MLKLSEQLFQEAQQIFATILKISSSEIKLESSLQDDLGIDSVDFWDILAAFSKRYKIKISEKDIENLNTVRELILILESKITKN